MDAHSICTASQLIILEPGFRYLYMRKGSYMINGRMHDMVIQIAAVDAVTPGRGAFKRLVEDLKWWGAPILVECVNNERFIPGLLRMGFVQVNHGTGNHFLLPVDAKHNRLISKEEAWSRGSTSL